MREGNVKPTDYKVCVLGLWAAQEAEGRRLVELADALESGRWVKYFTSFPAKISHVVLFICSTCCPVSSPSDWHVVTSVALTLNVWLLLVWLITSRNSSRTAL